MNAEIGKRKTCTCVVPCYNEEETIPTFYREMKKIRKQMEEYLNIILYITVFLKEFLDGGVFVPNGFPMRIGNGLQEKPNGLSGNCSCIP